MMTPEEQWRLDTAKTLGRIEEKVDETYIHVESLNLTVSSQGERISALEGGRRALKALVVSGIGMVALLVSGAVAWITKGGE